MKTSLGSVISFLLIMVIFCADPAHSKPKQNTTPQQPSSQQPAGNVPSSHFQQQLIAVEDLSAEVHPDSGTIIITAKIKNVSMASIKGYATVHLLSDEGKRLLSYEEEINSGEAFAHGQNVEFEVSARVGDVTKISSITVDFTKT